MEDGVAVKYFAAEEAKLAAKPQAEAVAGSAPDLIDMIAGPAAPKGGPGPPGLKAGPGPAGSKTGPGPAQPSEEVPQRAGSDFQFDLTGQLGGFGADFGSSHDPNA